jgi:hypothetical protein
MRTSYLPIFVITLLVAWVFLGWFGTDSFEYVGDLSNDGRAWIKAKDSHGDTIMIGFVLAVVFAIIETALLWCWNKLRTAGDR